MSNLFDFCPSSRVLPFLLRMSRMWTVYDHLFSSIFWVTGTVGIVLNTYLIYLIFFHAPETLKVYRVFLANATIADLIFAISTTFAQIRIIPNKWAFAYVPLGPAAYFGSEVSYISYCIMLHSLFYTFLSYPLSFGFRYSVLVRPMPSIKTCVLICLALWTIAIAQLNMRESTVRGHRRLMHALTIQASLPLLFVFPPILIYALYHFELINFTIIEYLVYVLFSFYPATSPLVTIYFVKPFKLAAQRLLCIPVRVHDISKGEPTAMSTMK